MKENKLTEINLIGYVGILFGLGGTLIPSLLNITNGLIQLAGTIVSIFGFYLILYKGRK
ncbi:MAG TPA: hypothetical protein ACFYEH_06360 [Candidatus Brocadiaceae bacterium]